MFYWLFRIDEVDKGRFSKFDECKTAACLTEQAAV
jgi:hypothetical protein